MLKKCAIFGLVLLLAGSAALGWTAIEKRKEQQQAAYYKSKYASELNELLKQYNEWLQLTPEEQAKSSWEPGKYGQSKTKAQLRQEQQERLNADLDELAAGEMYVHPFADILYGNNWQQRLSEYKKQKELKESITTGSVVCMAIGGIVCAGSFLLWGAGLFVKGLSWLTKIFPCIFSTRRGSKDKHSANANLKEDEENPPKVQKSSKQRNKSKKQIKALINLGCQSADENGESQPTHTHSQIAHSTESNLYATHSYKDTDEIAELPSEEKSAKFEDFLRTSTENQDMNAKWLNHLSQSERKPALPYRDEDSLKPEDWLAVQSENLEKQIEELKQLAQGVQQSAMEQSKPLNSTLKELAQELSAIRSYAAHQQERVKKLQEGYDWNIIRNFCLRIIRCIDNVEGSINRLSKKDAETVHLKEVRDELVFALESSGVERFEPAINSDYHGQEKQAEVVKNKEHSDDPTLKGKIAKVIRPGYQYFINEDNIKVVRTAQVKLFG